MIITWRKPVSGKLLFSILIFLIALAYFFPPDRIYGRHHTLNKERYRNQYPALSDSLPHYRYQKALDSLKTLEARDEFFNKSSGTSTVLFDCSVTKYALDTTTLYFFNSNGYDVDNLIAVSNKEPQSILTFVIWDSTTNEPQERTVIMPTSIKFRDSDQPWKGTVAVPVSNGMGVTLTVVSYLLLFLLGITGFCCVTFIPFRFFYNLSKGKSFTEENIGGLYLAGWGLVAISLFGSLLKIVAHLFIQSSLPPEIRFSYYAAIMEYWAGIAIGLSILLIAKSFLQALLINEEQALTI